MSENREAAKEIDDKISEKKVFDFFKDDKTVKGDFVSEKIEKNMIKYIKGKISSSEK